MTLRARPALILALAGLALPAPAQQPKQPAAINRPQAASRIVRAFDFESHLDDPDRAEVHPLPRDWSLAQDGILGPRPGFPIFNTATLDDARAFAGSGSLRLSTKGGSVGIRLDPGVIPVFPGTEYLISARVLTRGLTHARAAVRARYLDKSSAPIPGSETLSDLITTEVPDRPSSTDWRQVSVTLPDTFADAAYLQIDLELLQPQQFQPAALPRHQLWPSDFPADAWFDELAIVQLPRVRIETQSPVNIIRRPERPRVSIAVRDLAGQEMTARATLQDAQGRVIDSAERPVGRGQAVWDWEPKVADLGWYRAVLDLRAGPSRVGGTYVDLVWLPARGDGPLVPLPDRSRFAVLLSRLPDDGRALLPALVSGAGSGGVSLPIWTLDQGAAPQRLIADLSPLVDTLTRQGQQIAFTLARAPRTLSAAAHLDDDSALSLLSADPAVWSPALFPVFDKFGQLVQHWQLGLPGDPPPRDQAALARLSRLGSTMARLVPGPVLAVPWPAEVAPTGLGPSVGELVAGVPYAAPPESLGLLARSWQQSLGAARPDLTLALEPLPADYSHMDAAADLVKRAVEFWAAYVPTKDDPAAPRARIALEQPWDWPTPGRVQAMPHVTLAAWHNLAERLCGRRVVGKFPAGPGITCYILAAEGNSARPGALVAWRDVPGDAPLEGCLGDGPLAVVDLFGNASPLTRAPGTSVCRVPLTDRPVFVENVDAELARFIASFRLQPDAVSAAGGEHDVAIILSNPFPSRVDGRLTIVEPGRDRGWSVSPRAMPFSMGPGQSVRLPVTLAFSPGEEAGIKTIIAEAELTAERAYARVRLAATLEVHLSDLELDLDYRRAPGPEGPDLILEAHLTNRGRAATTLELTAYPPGLPRARASVADLAPGDTATRRFVFPGAAAALRGQRITVGVQDADSKARINRAVTVE